MKSWERISATFLTLTAALLLGACTTSPKPVFDYKQDYDFTKIRNIALYKGSSQVSGDNPLQLSDFQKERIDDALMDTLRMKGFNVVEDASQADMLLTWHLGTQNKTDVRTYETPATMSVGYGHYGGYNRYSMYNCWNCTNTEVRVSNYTEGTFIIDMIDPELRKSVWRSVTQSKLKGKKGEHEPGEINEAAQRVLAEFPPL